MKNITLTRQELYDLVWSEPIADITKKYLIWETDLKKMCYDLEIPLPEAEYWTKIQKGQKTIRNILLNKDSEYRDVLLKLKEEADEFKYPEIISLTELQKQIESDPRVNLKVPLRLTNPDEIISSVKDDLNIKIKEWHYDSDSLIISSWERLDIKVVKNNIERALRFMDSFIKAIKARGHHIKIGNYKTYIVLESEELEIALREIQKRYIVKGTYSDSTELKPTGKLALKIKQYSYEVTLQDGQKLLEDQLSKMIATIELKAMLLSVESTKSRQYHKKQEQERQIQIEIQNRKRKEFERKKKELKDFKDLISKSKRRYKAERIRAYIDELERRAIAENNLTNEIREHINWARKKADWYDPFIEAEDELLKKVNRNNLKFKKK